MRTTSRWAFYRRLQYGIGFGLFWILVFTGGYFQFFYEKSNCFDGSMNGIERGVDCGGACARICSIDVIEPNILWAQSFKVRDGQYNSVAYIENRNKEAATAEIKYTITIYDNDGLISEQKGVAVLPPDSVYPIFAGPIHTGDRVPTQTFVELEPVEVWLPAEVGRGQFTVVDRVLTGSDGEPRLDATIINNALIPAKDVEIVATIFDAKGNALTSSRTLVENFDPQSRKNVVFTWPLPIAKTLRSCEVPTDVVLAIDLSGSMNNDSSNPPEPITTVLSAAESFAARLKSKDQASVVTFATEASVNLDLTDSIDMVQTTIAELGIDPSEEAGSTNTGDAFARALEEFESPRHNKDARKIMVILTDGLATAPDSEPEEYALMRATELKESGVDVYAIGLGEQVNMGFVREIASGGSFTYQALSNSQVGQIYKTISADICEDGAAVIDIIPKTDSSFAPLQ